MLAVATARNRRRLSFRGVFMAGREMASGEDVGYSCLSSLDWGKGQINNFTRLFLERGMMTLWYKNLAEITHLNPETVGGKIIPS